MQERLLRWLLMILGSVIYYLLISIFVPIEIGIETFTGWVQYLAGIALMTIVPSAVITGAIEVFFRKHPFQPALEDELKREDDVLLQATAFSQAALWIYLNLTPGNELLSFLKILVPTIAIVFYSVRAFAKIKNSNLWRFRSVYAFSAMAGVTLGSLFGTTAWYVPSLKGIFLIDGVDVTFVFTIALIFAVISPAYAVLPEKIRRRYQVQK